MRADARLRVGWGQKPDTRLAETTGRVHAGARNGEAGAVLLSNHTRDAHPNQTSLNKNTLIVYSYSQ